MRTINKFLVWLGSLVLLCCLCPAALAATIEQVQTEMPDISVYLFEEDGEFSELTADGITAKLDGEPLDVESFARSEQGIYYIYALDVSTSMPEEHFNAALEAVRQTCFRLREQDKLALLTFGTNITLALSGGETEDEVNAVIDSLAPIEEGTMFYEALDELVSILSETTDMRRIAVVVSDGVQSEGYSMTLEELEDGLINSGVSLSALCINTADSEATQDFEEVIRLSGGEFYHFGADNADEVMDSLLDRLSASWLLELTAKTNLVDGNEHQLSIGLDGVQTLTAAITPQKWTPDEIAPYVESVTYEEDRSAFLVAFNEPVSGADDPAAYVFTADDGEVNVLAVSQADDVTWRVYTSTVVGVGSVSLTVRGLVDTSMEQNSLIPYSGVVYTPEAEASGGSAAWFSWIGDNRIILYAALGVVLVGGGIAAIVSLSAKSDPAGKDEETGEDAPKKTEKKKISHSTATTFVFYDKEKGGKK